MRPDEGDWLEFELRLRPPPTSDEREQATTWVTRQLALLTRAYERTFLPGGPTTLAPSPQMAFADDGSSRNHRADVVRLRPVVSPDD